MNKKNFLIVLETSILIALVVLLFGIKSTEQNTTTKKVTLIPNTDAIAINSFYNHQIDEYNKKLELINQKAITTPNKPQAIDYTKNLKLSIHKFVATQLKYNPYLPTKILYEKINDIFDTENVAYEIKITNTLPESLLGLQINQKIILHNNTTLSKTINNEFLIIKYSFHTPTPEKLHNQFRFDFQHYNKKIKDTNQTVTQNTNISTQTFFDEKFKLLIIVILLLISLYRIVINVKKEKNLKHLLNDFLSNPNINIDTPIIDNQLKNILLQSKNRKEALENTITNEIEIKKQFQRFIEDSSHQLNTPLTSIELNLDLMEMEFEEFLVNNEYTQNIKMSLQLLKLYNQELAYIASNKDQYKTSYFNGSELLYSRKKLFELIEKISNKKIIFKIETNIMLFINVEEFSLLIDNNLIALLKISKQYTSITIVFKKEQEKAKLIFSAKDIDNSLSNEIFDNYYRETKNDRKTGTGLYLSKEICIKNSIEYNILEIEDTNSFEYRFNLTSI